MLIFPKRKNVLLLPFSAFWSNEVQMQRSSQIPLGVPSVAPSQVQDLTFHLLNFVPLITSSLSRFFCKASYRVNSTSQFGVTSRSCSGGLSSCIQVIDKYIEQNWLSTWALRNFPAHQPDVAPFTANLWALPALQPVLHPIHREPAHPTVRQLLQKGAVRDNIKSLTKIQKNYIHLLPFILQAVILPQKQIKLIKQNFPFENPFWLCLMTALFFKCFSVVHSIIFFILPLNMLWINFQLRKFCLKWFVCYFAEPFIILITFLHLLVCLEEQL